ncbi:armadillo repeat-containing protein 7 [Limosa lapponica baueri]|uniref:Armadillo repeat-containing protein 7 n=1 Tax=Limosa lapponica baueri TaxID=1758121 RepID=A0A2I0TQC7_LIMLA|nr:armadillo repeat-containing protein 7 [Limosa lapponica baueri]
MFLAHLVPSYPFLLPLSFKVSLTLQGGLCNLCLDKTNKDYILEANGVEPVINCLSSSNEETVMSAVTTLMYLTTPQSRQQTTALPVVECMLRFSLSANRRLSNLATVFLEDYCTPPQVEEARNLSKHTAVGIPLPKD